MTKLNNNMNDGSLTAGPSFTVVTYNVLADRYATSQKFPNCPSYALGWEYRRPNLLKEILQCQPDIICLQEVQHNHFCNFFKPELAKLGYEGLFKEKKRGYFTETIDGCATFYKVKEFDLIRWWWIGLIYKDNIALHVQLSFKKTNQLVVIANTHIHANPENSDIKLLQVDCLLKRLENELEQENDCVSDIPLVICGDFNSLPGSAPHSLLIRGFVHSLHKEFRHALPLASAYSSYFQCNALREDIHKKMDRETGEPRFTNFVKNDRETFEGTLDYILYSTTKLKVVSLLELIDEDEVKPGGLPTVNRSSDHIPIAAEFTFNSLPKLQ